MTNQKNEVSKIIRWRDEVLEDDQLDSMCKLLALTYIKFSLAGDQYPPHGLKTVFPSTETVMRLSSIKSNNTIIEHRLHLIDAGYLINENKDAGKGGKAVTYRLTPTFPSLYRAAAERYDEDLNRASGEPNRASGDQYRASDGSYTARGAHKEGLRVQPRVKKESKAKSPSSSSATATSTSPYSADHQTIWGTYPRRGKESESLKAYSALRESGVPHAVLAASVTAYLADIGDNPKKFALANFFAKGMWEDYKVDIGPQFPADMIPVAAAYDDWFMGGRHGDAPQAPQHPLGGKWDAAGNRYIESYRFSSTGDEIWCREYIHNVGREKDAKRIPYPDSAPRRTSAAV